MQRQSTILPTSLSGKRIVLTGYFECDRQLLKNALVAEGALVYGSVLENTDLLVVGSEGSSKIQKAHEYGVPVIASDEVIAELRRRGHKLPTVRRMFSLSELEPAGIPASERMRKAVGDVRNFEAETFSPDFSAESLARKLKIDMQRQIDDALATVVAAVMLQLDLKELLVDDAIRHQVQEKLYVLVTERCPGAIKFTLTERPDDGTTSE